MRIGFRVDAGPKVGLGHFFRCLALAESYAAFDNEVFFISRGLPSWLSEIGSFRGITILPLKIRSEWIRTSRARTWLGAPSEADSAETTALAKAMRLDLLWVDHYAVDSMWLLTARGLGIPIAQIADYPAPPEVDFVLDYGFDASEKKHECKKVYGERKLFLGPEYAPIPQANNFNSQNPRQFDGNTPHVLVAMGSAVSSRALETLVSNYKFTDRKFDLMIADSSIVRTHSGGETRQETSFAVGLGSYLESSFFALTSGGVSMYERIAHGVPGLTFQTAANQSPSLTGLRERGLLGTTVTTAKGVEGRGLIRLMENALSATDIPEKKLVLQSTIDFSGSRRAAYFTGCEFNEELTSRRFRQSDAPLLFRWANDSGVRSNSLLQRDISPSEHIVWFESLESRGSQIIIFEKSGIPFGQVRFDRSVRGTQVLDYSIDRIFRGTGLGKMMLSSAIAEIGNEFEIEATVKLSNPASIHTLLSLGFEISESRGNLDALKLSRERG